MQKTVLVSVGGSPAPVIHTLDEHRPDRVIFFVSSTTYDSVFDAILPALSKQPARHDTIVTADEQDLVACVNAIMKRIPEIMSLWKMDIADLEADYTGGTKTMSAAVVLTLADHIRTFSYVGGTRRNKDGVGTVTDGSEQLLKGKNPWDVLAVPKLKMMAMLFNRCRFMTVMEQAHTAAEHAADKKPVFDALKVAAEAYFNWDNFNHAKAFNLLKQAESKLKSLCSTSSSRHLIQFAGAVSQNLATLEKVNNEISQLLRSKTSGAPEPDLGRLFILDLLANAVRRGEIEHKYDDAVARLYSAIEKMAKLRLKSAHNIDNSDVKQEQIPESLREELLKECSNDREERIQLPLHKSYLLLEALGDPLGRGYAAAETELAKILSIRNTSLLAHGFEPVKQETYEKMLTIALDFIGATREELPAFPRMSWENSL